MSYFEQQYSRCRHCKYHFVEQNGYIGSVLGPIIKCGKTNGPVHDQECDYFEPKNGNEWFNVNPTITSEWNLDKYKGLNFYGHE